MGFSFDLDALRELLSDDQPEPSRATLVAYAHAEAVHRALDHVEALHRDGTAAELLSEPVASREEAARLAQERGHGAVVWIG